MLARVAVLLLLSLPAHGAWVNQFTPQERVDQQTRATAVFSADMVPLGQVLGAAPFSVDCGGVKGNGRWVDSKTWAWQLERTLQAGERCLFSLKKGLKAVNGEAVYGQKTYRFFAPGPWPRQIHPAPGNGIEEDQAFVITPAGPVKPASVEQNAWCEAEGVGHRLALRLVAEPQRKEILAALRREGNEDLVVACSERLPPGAKMKLVWGKGIEAAGAAGAEGAKSTREESFVYAVREPFRATLSCEREKASAPCSPLAAITLEFSAAIDATLRDKIRLITPDGTRLPVDPNRSSGSRENTLRSVSFARPFAQNAELRLELPPGLKDDAGRPLANAANFPLKFRTGTLPPLAKFPGDFGIVELKEGGVLPVTMRNIEARVQLTERRLSSDAEVIAAMQALTRHNARTRQTTLLRNGKPEEYVDPYYGRESSFLAGQPGLTRRELPKPGGSAEFEVIGIPLTQPGLHIVEIESRLLGTALLAQPKPMYVRTAALVTNLAVHLKRGTDNALVWVTALDSGQPVAGAQVQVSDCKGKSLWSGKTDAQGRALTAAALAMATCDNDQSFLFASARLGEDYSFVRSDWSEGIEPWRFGVNAWGESDSNRLIHTVFDRSLLRPGQTLSMKHIARERNSRGMHFPDPAALPKRALIRHDSSGAEYPLELAWDAQGTATSQWKIPDAAKRGTYSLNLSAGASTPAEFRVSDFRLPVFTGRVQGSSPRLIAAKKVPLSLGLNFLNGGAAKGVAVNVSATVRPAWPNWPGYDRFRFQVDFNDAVVAAFNIDSDRQREELVLDQQALTLDQGGAGKLDVALKNASRGPAELYAEMRFPDPNGEIQTIHGSVPLWPAAVVLGMSIPDWASASDRGRIDLVALDLDGKPVAGQELRVTAKKRLSHSHRRRIVGGFYAYENRDEYIDLGEVCSGRSDARGILRCTPEVSGPGEILLLAETRDAQGNTVRAGSSYWSSGGNDEDAWFAAGNQDRIDVIPEKKSYKAGDTARFQVRTPFREATALISVEAGGIIETHVQPLSRFKPVIELPVKAEWAPNVYVSVLVVRGRIEPLRWHSFFRWGWREPAAWFREWWNPSAPTAMVDLAKPAWRIGLAGLDVGSEGMSLKVEVLPERKDYRPREEAVVRLKVSAPGGKPLPAGSEIAFAAVDQALLELQDNASWKLLDAMTPQRAYEVQTATAQSQVIGKRHYGRKAVPPGGGGGRAPARELFDTLLSWQPRVKVGANGTAIVKVPVNDALTEFRLVGVATAGSALFGSGSASIRTRQELQLISGLPPLVREKDRYQAMLTLRNGTAKPMSVKLTARAGNQALDAREVKLDADAAAEVTWSVQAPENVTSLDWEFDASQTDGTHKDRLKITQRIEAAVPVTVQQASFARIDGSLEIPVAPPPDALPGKGGIELALSPKLALPPSGMIRYFEDYPFTCLEQKTSVAVGLKDPKRWSEVVDSLPALLDSNGLARYFPGDAGSNAAGSVALTTYLLDMATLSGATLPAELRTRMEEGLLGFVEGRTTSAIWAPAQTDAQLAGKLMALEALTRSGRKPVKAASALDLNLLRLPTSALIDWWLIAKRLTDMPERSGKLAAADRELRNRLSYSGGRLIFTTEKSDAWWWLMVSGDSNSFRLIEAMLDEPAWRDDLPKLLRGAMERQVRGRWATTIANAWAVVALDGYAKRYERDVVSGVTKAQLAKRSVEHRWKDAEGNPKLSLPWPAAADKLAITHQGSGKPWVSLQTLAAVATTTPRAAGYRISREVTPLQAKEKGRHSRGDLWRVRLTVDAEQDMSWVVISDPIPAGARILGEGDGRDSRLGTAGENRNSAGVWPSYIERTFANFRAYYELVPRGRFSVEYTVRLNNTGEFALPATRVEAMYAPDVFGEQPNAKLVVGP